MKMKSMYKDRIDTRKDFSAENCFKSNWTQRVETSVRNVLKIVNFSLPEGIIVEYGVGYSINLEKIKADYYPEKDILGFDIKNFSGRPWVKDLDVRNICSYKEFKKPIALAINELPNWHESYITKQAGYDHAMNNLVVGGIYIEARQINPEFYDYPRHVYENDTLKKIYVQSGHIGFIKIKD